jgi:hypothetical protein
MIFAATQINDACLIEIEPRKDERGFPRTPVAAE